MVSVLSRQSKTIIVNISFQDLLTSAEGPNIRHFEPPYYFQMGQFSCFLNGFIKTVVLIATLLALVMQIEANLISPRGFY